MTYTFHGASGLHTLTTRYGKFTAHSRDLVYHLARKAEQRELQRMELMQRSPLLEQLRRLRSTPAL